MHARHFLSISAGVLLCAPLGCNGPKNNTLSSCIQPPVFEVDDQGRIASEVTAKLAEIQLDVSASSKFESLLKANFTKLSDRNASLLLFLRAIECYMQSGQVGEEIAREMAAMVREEWSKQSGFRGTDGPLTPLEEAAIKRSSAYQSEILSLLKKYHVGVSR